MTLLVLNGLVLAGSCKRSVDISSTAHGGRRSETYNKLQYSSILLLTALPKSIITQMPVKPELRQSELGISAGRLRLAW